MVGKEHFPARVFALLQDIVKGGFYIEEFLGYIDTNGSCFALITDQSLMSDLENEFRRHNLFIGC